MRSREELQKYEDKLDEHYLSNSHVMTDLELHNTIVKIDRALRLFENGLEGRELKKEMDKWNKDEFWNVPPQKYEDVKQAIERQLIKEGYTKKTSADCKIFKNELERRIKKTV